MSKYDDLCTVVEQRRKQDQSSKERCWGYMIAAVNGFKNYLDIPNEQIQYLKWNGVDGVECKYSPPDEGGMASMVGAQTQDQKTGEWRLGLHISFARPRSTPEGWVFFVLCVSEVDGELAFRVGTVEKPRRIDFKDEAQTSELYEGMIGNIRDVLTNPRKESSARAIGFITESP